MARRCKKCNTWNEDVDYCKNCGEVISLELQEKLDWEVKKNIIENKAPDQLDVFFEGFKNSRFFLIRAVYFVLHSVWVMLISILTFFMYFIAVGPG